jgi:autophagy-related protein 16-1
VTKKLKNNNLMIALVVLNKTLICFSPSLFHNSFTEQIKLNQSLRAEVQMLTTKVSKLEELNSTLRDEHTALHLLHCSTEEKLRKIQSENSQLIERLMKFKAKDAEKMNEDNESFLR